MDQRDFNPLYYAAKPVTMARRSGGSGALDDLGEALAPFVTLAAVIIAALSPVWIPALIVKEMYDELHPVGATALAIPFVVGVIAAYVWLWRQYQANKASVDRKVKRVTQPGTPPKPEGAYAHISTPDEIRKMMGR